jgi:ubiquinone/menaquinone biosynthesis C-methylase UbiE
MTSKSRWEKAQNSEVEYHQMIGNDKLHWFPRADRFDLDPNEFFDEKNVLEVGCGSSGVTYSISKHYTNIDTVVGLDPILGKVQNKQIPKEPIVQSVGESLPFKNNKFDIVVSINVLDHSMNPDQILKEISRVLKGGGTFLFMVNIYNLPKYIRKRMNYIDRPHPHHFSGKEVRDLLYSNGFDIKREVKESRNVLSKNLNQWSVKWLAASLIFRMESLYLICNLKDERVME